MRRTLGILALGGVIAIAAAQNNGGALLGAFAKALHEADSLKSTYTIQVVGKSPENYSVMLKKPNFARIDAPKVLIVADGKTITTFDKAEKTYMKKPQTEAELKALFANDELNLFSGFFTADAYKAASVKALGEKNRKGQTVQAVQANVDPSGKKTVTYFLGSDGIARAAQVDLNDPTAKLTYIVDTKSLEVGAPVEANLFAFAPPAGARELTEEELNATKWYTNLEEAKAIAAKTGKKIFVDFYATWCGPCKKLEAEVLSTPEFNRLSSKLVFLRIDVDHQKDVAQAYRIEAMPTQMVLDKNGSVLSSKVGYGSPSDFYGWLRPNL